MLLFFNVLLFLYLAGGVAFAVYIEVSEKRKLTIISFVLVSICYLPVILIGAARGDDDDEHKP